MSKPFTKLLKTWSNQSFMQKMISPNILAISCAEKSYTSTNDLFAFMNIYAETFHSYIFLPFILYFYPTYGINCYVIHQHSLHLFSNFEIHESSWASVEVLDMQWQGKLEIVKNVEYINISNPAYVSTFLAFLHMHVG